MSPDFMSSPTLPPRLKEILKTNRERRNISLQTVHKDTKISLAYLEALEAGQYEKFPAEVYCLGFLRKYAAYLGMNPDEALAQYKQEQETVEVVVEQKEEEKEEPTNLSRIALLTFLLGCLGGWWVFTIVRTSSQQNVPKPTTMAQRGMTPVFQVLDQQLTLVAHAHKNVWMRILPDKSLDFEGFVAAGSTRTWNANDEIFLRVGNVESVSFTLNGAPVDIRAGAVGTVNEMILTRESLTSTAQRSHYLPVDRRSASPPKP